MMTNYKIYETCNPDIIRLYSVENIKKSLNYRKKIQKSMTKYFLKQKLSGAALFIIGILCPIVMDGDATVSLFVIPFGIFLIVTKQQIMDFKQ